MNSRQACRKPFVLSLLPIAIIAIVLAFIFLSLNARSAFAATATSHVDEMVLNSEINPASWRFLTRSINTSESDGPQPLVLHTLPPPAHSNPIQLLQHLNLNTTQPTSRIP